MRFITYNTVAIIRTNEFHQKMGRVILASRQSQKGYQACLGDWRSRKNERIRLKKGGARPRMNKSERLILVGNKGNHL